MAVFNKVDLTLVVIFLSISCTVSSTKLCQKDGHWYDANNGKCRPCDSCGTKSLELEPCSEFRNTMCVDLSLLGFDLSRSHRESVSASRELEPQHHKWHEMETMGSDNENMIMVAEAAGITQQGFESSPSKLEHFSLWDVGVVIVLCLTLAAVLVAIVVTIVKQPSRWSRNRTDNRKRTRARLFSRDRLSTTEYMNNLATLDRRLAMDEILEKRKKAIFEPPQLLAENNLYTDEVFVDISGTIPRNFEDENDHEPTRSLLLTTTNYTS